MQVVIWGAGKRGARLVQRLEANEVVAFIDRDIKKQGAYLYGKPIISFQEYKEKYSEYFILISVMDAEQIIKELEEEGIYSYFDSRELIAEMIQAVGSYEIDYNKKLECYKWENNICIYGTGFYGLRLYEKIRSLGWNNVYLTPELKCNKKKIENIKKCIPGIQILESSQWSINNIDRIYYTLPYQCELKKLKSEVDISIINVYDLSNIITEYWNEDLEIFKDAYKGKRCFVIATGPSLRKEDLETLEKNNEYAFGVNRLYNMFDKVTWRPQFYMVEDPTCIEENADCLKAMDVQNIFISDRTVDFWKQTPRNVYKFHARIVTGLNKYEAFSRDIVKRNYVYATVVYSCLQLAVYMGFKEIYLLGVDCNYTKGSRDNYFFKEDKADTINHNEKIMIRAFESAEHYAEEYGVSIYNATRGGMLEVFERVDFDSLFKK